MSRLSSSFQTPARRRTLAESLSSLTRNGALNCLLGLAALRIWSQGVMFDSYRQSDDGWFSLVASLVYSVAYLILGLMALRRQPREHALGWVAFGLLLVAPLVTMVFDARGGTTLFVVSTVLVGLGAGLGGIIWILPYRYLSTNEAVLYTFATLAITALGSLVVSFVPRLQAQWLCVLMAPIVFVCYQQALHRVTPCEGEKPLVAVGPTYGAMPRSTLLIVLGGTAVFGFMLGVSRGYPSGGPVELGGALRLVHQLGVVVLALAVLWWTLGRRHPLNFSFLWRVEIGVAACAMLVLLFFPNEVGALAFGVALTNIANSFMSSVIWLTVLDIARHSSWHPYTVCGCTWCVRGLSRDAGRLVIMALAASSHAVSLGIGVLVVALSVSMALLLSDNRFASSQIAARSADRAPLPDPEPSTGVPAGDVVAQAFERRASELKDLYGLTPREVQVAVLIARGHSKTYIGEQLGLKENTVRTHTKNLYAKLGVQSREQLMELFG